MWIGLCYLSGSYCGVGVIRTLLDKLRQNMMHISSDSMAGAAGLVCRSLVVPGMEGPLHFSPSPSTNRMPLHSPICRRSPHQLHVAPQASAAGVGWCLSPPAQPSALESILEDPQLCCAWTLVR